MTYSPEQWALAGTTALGALGSFVTVIMNAKRGKRTEEKVNIQSTVGSPPMQDIKEKVEQQNGAN